MDCNNNYIAELTKAAIFDFNPPKPDKSLNWNYIFSKSVEQNISGLLFTAVQKLDDEFKPKKELYFQWQKKMFITVAIADKLHKEFMRVYKIIRSKGIKAICLKGVVLRNLYMYPELRTMGDFDILVEKKDISGIKKIFTEEGYEVKNDEFGIVCHKDMFNWDVFFTLAEEYKINTKKWDEMILKNTVDNDNLLYFNPTLFLSHIIIHTAKHFMTFGAGIRNLCDISLYINRYRTSINFEKVCNICAEQGYEKVYNYIMNIVSRWSGEDITGFEYIEDEKCDKFVEYFLSSGIFGENGNTLTGQLTKTECSDISKFRQIFLPPKRVLEQRYSYLKKSCLLLPIAWLHRFFNAVFKRKFSVFTMIKDMDEAIEFSEKRKEKMKELEIE